MKEKTNLIKRVLLVFFLIFIFIFQILPIRSSSQIIGLDKIIHFIFYFVLMFLFSVNNFSLKRAFFYSFLYGILMEIVQIPVPTRSCSFYDLLANLGGILTFLIIKTI